MACFEALSQVSQYYIAKRLAAKSVSPTLTLPLMVMSAIGRRSLYRSEVAYFMWSGTLNLNSNCSINQALSQVSRAIAVFTCTTLLRPTASCTDDSAPATTQMKASRSRRLPRGLSGRATTKYRSMAITVLVHTLAVTDVTCTHFQSSSVSGRRPAARTTAHRRPPR